MKLTDPWFEAGLRFVAGGTSKDVASLDEANAVFFYCPCAFGRAQDERAHGCLIPFANPRNGVTYGPQGWAMSGTGLADLSLSPSLLIGGVVRECWHGFLTNGEFRSC